jgi:hypothetical protein
VADGGYFDNFSVMTVVDFLRGVLPNIAAAGRRVLIVEIRASDSTQRTGPRLGEGFRLEVMGPADTLMAVRGTSQLERNQLELALLRELWRTTVESRPAVFELRADTPLSWHLSSDERESIRKYWDARCDHNQRALAAVAAFFKVAEPPAPPGAEAVCTRPERRPGAAVSRDAA